MKYMPFTLESGVAVALRAPTYAEWEAFESDRVNVMEAIGQKAGAGEAELALAISRRGQVDLRGKRLTALVENFDNLKDTLSLRDVAEIEKLLLDLEDATIPLGNLNAGGSGAQATSE